MCILDGESLCGFECFRIVCCTAVLGLVVSGFVVPATCRLFACYLWLPVTLVSFCLLLTGLVWLFASLGVLWLVYFCCWFNLLL